MLKTFELGLAAVALSWSCNSGPSCPTPGGAVSAAPDNHCAGDAGAAIVQTTTQASCHPVDAAAPDGAGAYGPTLDNASADDDDCKYHISWTSSPVCQNDGIVFTVVATSKSDGTPLTGANMDVEVFLDLTHPSPTPFVDSAEGPPGTYVTQPAKFDKSGKWTVRFHFFEECSDDLEDSPHGHAAFFVNVP